jgi:thiamine biosynthesis protein ThiI
MVERRDLSYEHIKLHPTRGRIFLYTDDISNALIELTKCFGIISSSPAVKVPSQRQSICQVALKLAKQTFTDHHSFAVRTKRVGQHPFTSQEIAAEVGAYLLQNLDKKGLFVDLNNPHHTLHIEIRDKEAFLFNEIIPGPAGMPYGSQGKVISLFSGGIDSPVATWFMMKRGCDVIPLFCDLDPFTTPASEKRTLEVLQKLYLYSPYRQLKVYIVPHGVLLQKISQKIPPKFTCLFCKRAMYKIASKLADSLGAKAIITGENLAQVASQTLDNLYVLDQATNIPIFRPLIGFEKNQTIKLSQTLGFYETSIQQVPSCAACPQYPETHGRLEDILTIERDLNLDSLLNEELQNLHTINLEISPQSQQ